MHSLQELGETEGSDCETISSTAVEESDLGAEDKTPIRNASRGSNSQDVSPQTLDGAKKRSGLPLGTSHKIAEAINSKGLLGGASVQHTNIETDENSSHVSDIRLADSAGRQISPGTSSCSRCQGTH